MPGPQPKNPATRRRTNSTSSAAVLTRDHDVQAPELPQITGEPWHPYVVDWWESIWRSPMAPEWEPEADVHGLVLLAQLRHDFWMADTAKQRQQAAAEIRLHDQRFGLSPMDRRRLQWAIEAGDQAQERTDQRRWRRGTPPPEQAVDDPRSLLTSVG